MHEHVLSYQAIVGTEIRFQKGMIILEKDKNWIFCFHRVTKTNQDEIAFPIQFGVA